LLLMRIIREEFREQYTYLRISGAVYLFKYAKMVTATLIAKHPPRYPGMLCQGNKGAVHSSPGQPCRKPSSPRQVLSPQLTLEPAMVQSGYVSIDQYK